MKTKSHVLDLIIFLVVALSVSLAQAAPFSFVYEGVLLDSSNLPITTATAMTFRLYNPSVTCLLYEENQTVTPSTTGSFSVLVGSTLGDPKRGVNDKGFAMESIFAASGVVANAGANCVSGYSASLGDTRKLSVAIGGTTLSGVVDISSAPFAINAGRAEKLTNYLPGDLLKVDPVVDKTLNPNSDLTQVQYDEFWRLIKNPSTAYVTTSTPGALAGDVTGAMGTSSVVKIRGVAVSATAPTSGQVLTLVGSTWTPTTPAASGISSVLGTLPITASGSPTATVSIAQATTSTDGYLSAANWNTFNNKMSPTLTSATMWVGNAGNAATAVAMSGDATISNTGVVGITAGAITGSKLSSGGVVSATSGILLANTTGNLVNQTCSTNGQALLWTVTGWACGTPTAAMPGLTDGKMWLGNTSNVAMPVTMSGDATINNAGVLSLVASGVVAGSYAKVNVDAKGRVIAGQSLISADITTALGFVPISASGTSGGIPFYSSASTVASSAVLTQFGVLLGGGAGAAPTATALGTSGQVLTSNGAGVAPTYQAVSLASATGTLPISSGGTGGASAAAARVSLSVAQSGANTDVTSLSPTGTLTLSPTTSILASTPMKGPVGTSAAPTFTNSTDSTTGFYFPTGGTSVGIAVGGVSTLQVNSAGISMAPNKYFSLSANTVPGSTAGQMWYDTGVIKYFDGTTTKSLGVAGAGIMGLNGLTSATQTFAVGSAGTDFTISSVSNTHTFNLPNASASNRGVLSTSDWSNFNSKLSNALTSASLWVGSAGGFAAPVSMSGDAAISNTGVVTVDKTTTGIVGKILALDATGTATMKAAAINSGTGTATLASAVSSSNYLLRLPAGLPASDGQVLTGLTSGITTWTTVGGNYATVTTAAMTMYVRSDGDDTLCNGLANNGAVSAPNCGFATLQGALNKVPDIIKHNVDIRITSTLNSTVAAKPMAIVDKVISTTDQTLGPILTIEGYPSATTLSNGYTGVTGLLIHRQARGVYIKNITFSGFDKGIDLDGGVAIAESITLYNNTTGADVSRAGMLMFTANPSSITLASSGSKSSVGLDISGASRVSTDTNLNFNLATYSGNRGISISGGEFALEGTASVLLTDSASATQITAVDIGNGGNLNTQSGTTLTLNMSTGNTMSTAIQNRGGQLSVSGSLAINSVAGNGLVCDLNSSCQLSGPTTFSAGISGGRNVSVNNHSSLVVSDNFLVTSPIASGVAAVEISQGSNFVYSPYLSGRNLSFSNGSAGSIAFRLSGASTVLLQSSVVMGFTFQNSSSSIFNASGGSIIDNNTTYGGTITGDIMLDTSSRYNSVNTNFPVPKRSCDPGMQSYGVGQGSFCMETADNASANFYTAINNCAAKNMKLCTTAQYAARCATGDYISTAVWSLNANSVTCTASTYALTSPAITTSFTNRCCRE